MFFTSFGARKAPLDVLGIAQNEVEDFLKVANSAIEAANYNGVKIIIDNGIVLTLGSEERSLDVQRLMFALNDIKAKVNNPVQSQCDRLAEFTKKLNTGAASIMVNGKPLINSSIELTTSEKNTRAA